ncbi:hypothetical protein HZH68_011694 [Vespula germanica]|uniref:Uncharacterized protein n=1 Tax=Vespula germanica TaxID=30212 RepID=A0A834MYJ1_VESGE|nr:hypothetical protein HZH68_011694 [Vespula germanica]
MKEEDEEEEEEEEPHTDPRFHEVPATQSCNTWKRLTMINEINERSLVKVHVTISRIIHESMWKIKVVKEEEKKKEEEEEEVEEEKEIERKGKEEKKQGSPDCS